MKTKILGILVMTLLIVSAYTINAYDQNIFDEINLTNINPNDPDFGLQWNLHNIGQSNPHSGEGDPDCDIDAPEAWDIETGNPNVIVAVIDCGIDYTHPDLADNIWINEDEIPDNDIDDDNNGYIDDIQGWNFFDNNNDLIDLGGHGTAHAGVIAAVGNNGIGISGVTWNCKIMPIHCVDEFDYGTSEDIADGIRYAVDNGASVISMSFGKYTDYEIDVQEAIEYAYNSNVVLVAAAGNEGSDWKLYPAGYDQVIAVGGTDNKDHKMDCYRYDGYHLLSNYGDWIDVSAPAVDIYTTFPTYHVTYMEYFGFNYEYDYLSGTSFSGPQVSGIAALLLSKNPTLNPNQVKAIICDNVDPYISDVYIGTGRANAYKALTSCNPPNTPSINGPNSGKSGENYEYIFMAIDPDGQNITYLLDWGDDTSEVRIGPFPSGEEVIAMHSWAEQGNYTISVKSIDIYELESDWATLEVSMPKNKSYIDTQFLNFLEQYPHLFPLLRQLLGL